MATSKVQARKDARLAKIAAKEAKRKANMQARIEARYARADAEAKKELEANQSFEQVFTKYQSYMTYLQNLPDDERKQILGDLTEEANALVDKPFDAETERLRKDLDLRIRKINQQYGALDENTQRELSQALEKADRDTIDALSENFEAVVSRGLMNGGILAQLADKVMNNREDYVKNLRADTEAILKQRADAKALDQEGIDLYRESQESDISDRRRIARSVQESDLFTEQATLKFWQEQGLAGRLLPQELATQLDRLNNAPVSPATGTAASPASTPASSVPQTSSRLPEGYAPAKKAEPADETSVGDSRISVTQRRILSGSRPSVRGIRQSASNY